MLKKVLLLLSAASVLLLAASGCSAPDGIADTDNTDLVVEDIYDSAGKTYHDLSADGVLHVSYSIDSGEEVILLPSVGTNSTKISVANNSGAAVTVYLYYDGNTDSPIQQFSLDNIETKAFTNLTSRFVYRIGIGADVGTLLDLTITD